MTVNSINENKIKISLNCEERYRLFGDADKLSCHDPAVRAALRAILRRVKWESGFFKDCEQVYVDVYKNSFGGCHIYLTKPKNAEENFQNIGLFVFNEIDSIISLAELLKGYGLKYKIYLLDRKFYLLAEKDIYSFKPLIEEFCDGYSANTLTAAKIGEYGKEINEADLLGQLHRL